ncbi:WD40/YVTN/BNR-like repeat-containing protein [Nannocystis pusilla]|uniref:WD40/YVTN/BNR-like repeat-containing protein n=1 Tax=Nannocystis pusilla TaxID=889268 RepID=UPI003BEF9211
MPRSSRSSRLLASFALAAAAGAALPGAIACNPCDLYYRPIEWRAEEVPVEADLFAVAAAEGVVVAVGEGGAIARQAGEAAWTAPASATGAALRGVEFAAAEVVVAVGDGGVVVRSVDAGETWGAVDVGVKDDLAAVGCDDAGTCVAAGDGVLLVSTDAGASWAPPVEAPAELGALRAVGVNTGFAEFVAVGLAGAVVISPDGQTWTAVPGASADFHAVAQTASNWALGGADGALFILTNGVFIDESQFDRATITGLTREGRWMVRADGVVVYGHPAWVDESVRTEEELPPLHAVVAIGDEVVVVGDGGLVGRARQAEAWECDRRYH